MSLGKGFWKSGLPWWAFQACRTGTAPAAPALRDDGTLVSSCCCEPAHRHCRTGQLENLAGCWCLMWSALYAHVTENTTCVCPKMRFHSLSEAATEQALGNNGLTLPSSVFFQMRKLGSRTVTLEAMGVLIRICVQFPLTLPLPSPHQNRPPSVLLGTEPAAPIWVDGRVSPMSF